MPENISADEDAVNPKKSLGFWGIVLIIVNTVMSLSVLGTALMAAEYGNGLYIFLVAAILVSLPVLARKKFKLKWTKVQLWSATWLIGLVVFSIIKSEAQHNNAYPYAVTPAALIDTGTTTEPQKTEYKIGDRLEVGYMAYRVKGIQWRKRLGNAYFGKTANARYLIVKVQIKNQDTQNRLVPPFHLVDESGSTYDESADRMFLPEEAMLIQDLNPNVTKQAALVFDVPPDHHYSLNVSGGYWSSSDEKVKLN